jgi:hypothetical protein
MFKIGDHVIIINERFIHNFGRTGVVVQVDSASYGAPNITHVVAIKWDIPIDPYEMGDSFYNTSLSLYTPKKEKRGFGKWITTTNA